MKSSKLYWIVFGVIVLAVIIVTIFSMQMQNNLIPELKECGELENVNDQDICIKQIADSKRDATFCNSVSQDSVKESCFKSVAFLTADKTICDSAGSLKEQCIEEVNELCVSCQKEGMICPDYYKC
jgi:hypothetical protein